MSDNYEDMTVAELKVLLKEHGLPVSGKKADLIERLSQSSQEEEPEVVKTLLKTLLKNLMMKTLMTMMTAGMMKMIGMMKKMKAMWLNKNQYFQMI